MSRVLPYVAFALCYATLCLVFSLSAELIQHGGLHFAVDATSSVVAALISIYVAQRVGRLSASGLLVTGLVLAVALYAAVWGIHHWQSVQVGSSVPFLRPVEAGGSRFVISLVVQILTPVVLRYFVPRPNNSFKPNQLRGSA